MWLLPVVAGAIVPHAPLLLPELESAEVAASAGTIRRAVRSLDMVVDVVVILTPHAPVPGVYAEVAGDLSAFGVAGVEGSAETDVAVAKSLGLPEVAGGVDHGVLVPLLLGGWDVPVVAVELDLGTHVDLDVDARVGVIGSVNLSAGLSPRAPLTEIPGATEREAAFVATLEDDVGTIREHELPGACGAAVIAEFARIFEGRKARVLAHEAPVGVGYLVAEIV